MQHAAIGGRRLAARCERTVDQRYSAASVLLQQLPRHMNADHTCARNHEVNRLRHVTLHALGQTDGIAGARGGRVQRSSGGTDERGSFFGALTRVRWFAPTANLHVADA